jgi:transcriptional regulator with XRE-family HTH domain
MGKRKGVPGLTGQLREAITASGLSLNKISAASGVGRDRLSRFVRGERDLTLSAAERICEALRYELTRKPADGAPGAARGVAQDASAAAASAGPAGCKA